MTMRLAFQFVLVACFGAPCLGQQGPAGNAAPRAPDPAMLRCERLAGMDISRGRITAREAISTGAFTPSGGKEVPNLPAFCRVAATLAPTADSSIRIEVWMPSADWNGRFLGTGNGGFAGAISYNSLADGVRKGYAVANTDMGLATPPGEDAAIFEGRPERWKDWGYRATHEMTVVSKRIVAAYYGAPAKRSYFSGCSTGGEQGLMEAQRFPGDYDGIVAGGAANNRTRLHMAILWTFMAAQRDPAANLPASKLPLLTKAVLAACSGGSGWIEDPRTCHFDPASLQCGGEAQEACLTAPEVETVRRIYSGPVNPRTGERIYPGVPVGSESTWEAFYLKPGVATAAPFQPIFQWVFGRNWDFRKFDYDRDVATVDARLAAAVNATDPDLSAFRAAGHKLIAYHGWADALVMPGEAVSYYEAVVRRQKSEETTGAFYRLFMAPGVGHCGGGPGPNRFDMLAPMVDWVENGKAPERIIATKVDAGGARVAARLLCPYPRVARYDGIGNPANAGSYACIAPSRSTR